MALQDARRRLYEDQVILHVNPLKLMVGKLSKPDNFGWRWFQCTDTLQILLPPGIGIRYNVFLKMEQRLSELPSSHTTIQRFNRAREDFINQCLHSKPEYPVRGISPSIHRYALEPGFECSSIDDIVADEETTAASMSMTTFNKNLVPRSQLGLLGTANDWGLSWARLTENTQVLLPADATSQYHLFLWSSILSDNRRAGWETAVANFAGACTKFANNLGKYEGDTLYVLERNMAGLVLASIAGALRSYYHDVAEKAWLYAQLAPTDASFRDTLTKHLERRPKRKRCVKHGIVLEPLAEVQEDVATDSDTKGGEWGSEPSLQFSVTTTVLCPCASVEIESPRGKKGSRIGSLRRTAKFLSHRMPARFCERLIALVARSI
ncbi:hypothetical protein F5876DRAFT_64152 [Lentinula aff. lateritia]|uniref:Uncharacterized protein n=1 Tax=Lentinula aff. lateritia TaxID=2804960 RepID=A0ACC1U565_9AGAR|nr:hypothetical protein F5876DRAFT_64152 [Lentinula aff. lateritia]